MCCLFGQALFDRLKGGPGQGEIIANPLLPWGVVGFPSREARLPFPDPRYHWSYVTGALDEMFGGFGSQTKTGQWNASTMNITFTASGEQRA